MSVAANSSPSTFNDVVVGYFEYQTRMMKLGHLKPYARHRHRRCYELHLSTTFGRMAFIDIYPLDIEDWMVERRDLPSTGRSNGSGMACCSRT